MPSGVCTSHASDEHYAMLYVICFLAMSVPSDDNCGVCVRVRACSESVRAAARRKSAGAEARARAMPPCRRYFSRRHRMSASAAFAARHYASNRRRREQRHRPVMPIDATTDARCSEMAIYALPPMFRRNFFHAALLSFVLFYHYCYAPILPSALRPFIPTDRVLPSRFTI